MTKKFYTDNKGGIRPINDKGNWVKVFDTFASDGRMIETEVAMASHTRSTA